MVGGEASFPRVERPKPGHQPSSYTDGPTTKDDTKADDKENDKTTDIEITSQWKVSTRKKKKKKKKKKKRTKKCQDDLDVLLNKLKKKDEEPVMIIDWNPLNSTKPSPQEYVYCDGSCQRLDPVVVKASTQLKKRRNWSSKKETIT